VKFSDLRRTIRSLILESNSSKEEKWPATLKHMTVRQRGLHGHSRKFQQEHPVDQHVDPKLEADHKLVNLPENENLKKLRRALKGHWNYWVKSKKKEWNDFWNGEKSPILAMHYINLIEDPLLSTEQALSSIKLYVENHGEKQSRDADLSCVGFWNKDDGPWYVNSSWKEEQIKKLRVSSAISILLHKRTINWAAYTDSWTEFISSAGEKELELYKGSGIPKRPYSGVSAAFVIFGPDELTFGTRIPELIVSNYEWDTFVLSRYHCEKNNIEIEKLIESIESYQKRYIIR